jgi:phosphotransferase system IIB component
VDTNVKEIQALQTQLRVVPKRSKPVMNKPATRLDQVHHALESQASTKTSTKGEFERQNSQELRCLGCFIRY